MASVSASASASSGLLAQLAPKLANLDAPAALLQTETNYYRALSDFRTAVARLKLAVGGELS